jgi:hypothetical protein
MGKWQRTGLTEGTLIYNNWLKNYHPEFYRQDCEDEFINWLYSFSGWYDKDISGNFFDIGVEAVKKSHVYQKFLYHFERSLFDSQLIHIMLHSKFHLSGLHLFNDYIKHLGKSPDENFGYWSNVDYMKKFIRNKRIFIINAFSPLIKQKYGVDGYRTPLTFFNDGPHQNSFETLDFIVEKIPKHYDLYLVSAGPYGCFIVEELWKKGFEAMTVGSGLHNIFPLEHIPEEYKPKDYKKIEDGRYWNLPSTNNK